MAKELRELYAEGVDVDVVVCVARLHFVLGQPADPLRGLRNEDDRQRTIVAKVAIDVDAAVELAEEILRQVAEKKPAALTKAVQPRAKA